MRLPRPVPRDRLAATPRLSRTGSLAGPAPRVSVIVPARNGERAITAAVGSQLAQDYPDFEVLVVNDRSTDRTGTILEALAREHPRLRIISGADPGPGWLGKLHALWLGAREASGEILLFADGARVSRLDLDLAVWGTALPIMARVVLAAALGDPLWPSFTHPIMAAVWAGITCRSLFQRIVLRRLTWRGREFDAHGARF